MVFEPFLYYLAIIGSDPLATGSIAYGEVNSNKKIFFVGTQTLARYIPNLCVCIHTQSEIRSHPIRKTPFALFINSFLVSVAENLLG